MLPARPETQDPTHSTAPCDYLRFGLRASGQVGRVRAEYSESFGVRLEATTKRAWADPNTKIIYIQPLNFLVPVFFVGPPKKEIRNSAPGFQTSCVFARTAPNFLIRWGFWPDRPERKLRNSAPEFRICWGVFNLAGPSRKEIRNSAPGFLISCFLVLGGLCSKSARVSEFARRE